MTYVNEPPLPPYGSPERAAYDAAWHWCSNTPMCGHYRTLHTPTCQGIHAGANDADYPDRPCECAEFIERGDHDESA